MFYNFVYPLADLFSPFNLFRYLTFRSIAAFLQRAGRAVTLLHYGRLAGYTLGTPGAFVYLSDQNAGALNDTPPAATDEFVQPVGRIFEMTDTAGTEYLFVDIDLAFAPVELA